MIEEPQIVLHETDEPDLLGDFFDADVLAGEDLTQVDLATADTDAAAGGDGDRAIVEGIFPGRLVPRRGARKRCKAQRDTSC